MAKNKKITSLVRIDHIWSVLCSNSVVDQASQNISLFSVLEQLSLNKKEIQVARKGEAVNVAVPFHLVSFFRKVGDGEFFGDVKTEVMDPEGKVVAKAESKVRLESSLGKDRLRIINRFPGIPITVPGYYSFRVLLRQDGGDYEAVGEVPLQIKFLDVQELERQTRES